MIADKDCDICGAKAGQPHRLLSEDPEWIRKLMTEVFGAEHTGGRGGVRGGEGGEPDEGD